jgi:hypothetical protein
MVFFHFENTNQNRQNAVKNCKFISSLNRKSVTSKFKYIQMNKSFFFIFNEENEPESQ